MGNTGYPELLGRIDAIVGMDHWSDQEKLSRIKATITDFRATRTAQRADYERQLEELEAGYKEQDYAGQ